MPCNNVNNELEHIIDIFDNEEDIENEATRINVNDCMNGTFLNPSQSENPPQEKVFNCEKCNFKADRKIDIMDNKKDKHNWCNLCFSRFNNKENLKEHIIANHKE